MTNKPILIESMDDMVDKLGYQGPETDANGVSKFTYTLAESAYASFALSKCAPVVMINVLDPAKHKRFLSFLFHFLQMQHFHLLFHQT